MNDEFFIFGLLENQGNSPVAVEIFYTLYDNEMNVVGSGKGTLYHDEIPSNQDVPFVIKTTGIPNIESYKLEVRKEEYSFHTPYRGFESFNINMKKEENRIKIGGKLKDIGNKVSEYTIAVALLYGSKGEIIDLLVETTNPLDVFPTESASFVLEESYSKKDLENIKDYKLWIQEVY